MTHKNPPARPHCVRALLCTSVLALVFAFTGAMNAATDTPAPQPPDAPAAVQPIETDLTALNALTAQDYPEGFDKMTRDQQGQLWDQRRQAITEKAFAIYDTYKDDRRRWFAVPYLFENKPAFFKPATLPDTAPKEDDKSLLVRDEDKIKGYEAHLAKIKDDMASATDVPSKVRQALAKQDLSEKLMSARIAVWSQEWPNKLPRPDITALRAEVDAFLAKYPKAVNDGRNIVSDYIRLEAMLQKTPADEILKTFAQSPNNGVKKYAQERFAFLDTVSKPLEMTFTAADGREVDLAKLRGKVVLVDFWATWCGPCIAELPNVKSVYSKYHDKGFEIVGIALEEARLAPKKDTPEQTEKKLADAKKTLLDFVAKQQMPWPQYFDGKGWSTDYAAKYNIRSVPTMFLLGKDGVLAVEFSTFTDAKREDLEKEVKRLLGL